MQQKIDELKKEYQNKGIKTKDFDALAKHANDDLSLLRRFLERRLYKEPIEYIIQSKLFWKRDFFVDRRVYIPTIETEELVQLVLDEMNDESVVLDVGTGCGNIAITIKKERPNNKVYGSDFHSSALEVASINKNIHGVDVEFIESYYVDDLNITEPTHIVADLPYGDWSEEYILDSFKNVEEIKHMPLTATFHPEGIGNAYLGLIESVRQKQWKSVLYLETGLMPEIIVTSFIPKGIKYQYIKKKGIL